MAGGSLPNHLDSFQLFSVKWNGFIYLVKKNVIAMERAYFFAWTILQYVELNSFSIASNDFEH